MAACVCRHDGYDGTMLQDRPYMRDSYDRPRTSVVTWLISAIVAVFLVQSLLAHFAPATGYGFDGVLGLSAPALKSGFAWTLVTYGFLHDTAIQVLVYVLAIYFIGREVLPILGARRFIGFYASALAAGGLAWTAIHWRHPEVLFGASAAVWALGILYACFYPNREVSLLLFFILPVTFKPKHLAYVMVAVDLFGCVFYEMLGSASPFGIAAHSAHLGGMAAAWIYFRYMHDTTWGFTRARADIELPRWVKQRTAKAAAPAPTYSVNIGGRGHLRAEVDRILDKINSDGFGSLSAEEKKLLDEARDLIGRR
jgi:membrane associated rhomboid family serine protease